MLSNSYTGSLVLTYLQDILSYEPSNAAAKERHKGMS
jgi:hypothetical protein